MNDVGMIVNVELWQVVFAAIMGCTALISVGFGAATVFVRRTDCHSHIDKTTVTLSQIFDLLRNQGKEMTDIKQDLAYLKGKLELEAK